MSIVSADKIFIDADEEINFIIHKVLNSTKERVILVIPQESEILRSLVSIKILAKQLLKSKKLLAVVTEDEFGRKISQRAGLVAIKKVSDVTPEIWEKVQLNKERDAELLSRHEKKLISDRQLPEEDVETPEANMDIKLEDSPTDAESSEQISGPGSLEDETTTQVEEEEEIISPRTKRIPAKTVEVPGGLVISAGGDILDNVTTDEVEELVHEEVEIPEGRLASEENEEKVEYVGRDWTRHTKDKKSRFPGIKLPSLSLSAPTFSNKKLIIPIIIFIILLFLVPYLFVANAFIIVDIKLKTTDVDIEQEITAEVGPTEVDEEKLILPALEIVTEEVSRSTSAQASGRGKTGTKAAGLIDFFNYTDKDVTISSGKIVKSVTTNLEYVVQETFTVPKMTGTTPGSQIDKRVEAKNIGEEYNIEGGANSQFIVDGYATSDVSARRIREITGGTSKEVIVVSQTDIDKLKQSLTTQVKEAAIAELNNKVPDGYKLLSGSQIYKEVKVTSEPELGKEATTFDVSLIGTANGIVVAEKDLKTAARLLAERSQEGTPTDFDFEALDIPDINNVKRDGKKVTFRISSAGKLQTKVNTPLIQNEIAGKTVEEAKKYLNSLTEIEDFEVDYSASFLPSFIQIIPNDIDKIRVRIE